MDDLEKDLRAAAYHLGAANPYLRRVGRTLTAQAIGEEVSSIERLLDLMGANGPIDDDGREGSRGDDTY